MNKVLDLIIEIMPYIISIAAAILSFKKGKVTKTAEEIEAQAEAKKQKYLAKLAKKNKVTLDTKSEETQVNEDVIQNIKETHFGGNA